MKEISLNMSYNFKGTINCSLKLRQNEDGLIDVLTDYNEIVGTIFTAYDLVEIIKELNEDKYA